MLDEEEESPPTPDSREESNPPNQNRPRTRESSGSGGGGGRGGGSQTGSLRQGTDVPTIRRIPASQLSFFPPPSAPPSDSPFAKSRNLTPGNLIGDLSPRRNTLARTPSTPSKGDAYIFARQPVSPPAVLGTVNNFIPSSLRGLPALFVAKNSALGSPRLSASSDEVSEDPEVELEDALDWMSNSSTSAIKSRHGQTLGGVVRSRRSNPRLQDIDWLALDGPNGGEPYAQGIQSRATTRGQGAKPMLLEPVSLSLKIQTQQPGPTPRMELPWSDAKPP